MEFLRMFLVKRSCSSNVNLSIHPEVSIR